MAGVIQSWHDCAICQDILDGKPKEETHNGLVALSKRCYHVFHKTCIERWLEEGKRECPTCRLPYFSRCEVVLNPEHTTQYEKWQADPQGYTYEQAFIDEYRRSSQEEGIDPSHIVRPRELRGQERRTMLTYQEIRTYYREVRAEIQKLSVNSTPEQIERAKKEAAEGENLMLTALEEWDKRQGEALDHQHLLTGYDRKVSYLDKKISIKKAQLDELPYTEENLKLGEELLNISTSLIGFSQEFTEGGRTNERTIAESQELLREIDAQLDAFVAGQPEHIKEILNAPLLEPILAEVAAPEEPPHNNHEPWWQSTTAKIAMLFAFIVGAITFRNYFWKGRNVKPQDEL